MTTPDLWKTCLHESGHAVACVRQGRQMGCVSATPDHDTFGRVTHEELSFDNADTARSEIAIAMAGYGAVLAHGHPDEVAEVGCGWDFEIAERIASHWFPGTTLADLKAEAGREMADPANHAAVLRVAQELVLRRRLQGEAVEVLVEVADGLATEEEWQRWAVLARLPPA